MIRRHNSGRHAGRIDLEPARSSAGKGLDARKILIAQAVYYCGTLLVPGGVPAGWWQGMPWASLTRRGHTGNRVNKTESTGACRLRL